MMSCMIWYSRAGGCHYGHKSWIITDTDYLTLERESLEYYADVVPQRRKKYDSRNHGQFKRGQIARIVTSIGIVESSSRHHLVDQQLQELNSSEQ